MKTYYVEVEIPVIMTVAVESDDEDDALEQAEQLGSEAMTKLTHASLTQNLIDYALHFDENTVESWLVDQD